MGADARKVPGTGPEDTAGSADRVIRGRIYRSDLSSGLRGTT